MITILPADKAFLESIAAPEGTDAMVLRDADGTVTGHGLFRVEGQAIEVLAVEADEPLMREGLVRSILNTGDCRGATEGVCRQEGLVPVVRRLEFAPDEEGVWRVSIAQFFRGECHCGKYNCLL